jgi:TolA-binding protein
MNLRTLILLLILPIYLLKGQTTQDYYSAVKFFQDGRYYESYILFEKFLKIKIPEDELYASAKFYASEALFNLGRIWRRYGGI